MSHALREAVRVPRAQATGTPAHVALPNALVCTVWFSLVAGMVESAILTVQRYGFHQLIYRSDHYLWMPSVGAFIVFGALMLFLDLSGRVVPSLKEPHAVLTVLLSLTTFSVFMVTRWLTPLSALLLAVGCAVMLLRREITRASLARLIRRTTGPLLTVLAALMLSSFVGPLLQERSLTAKLPKAGAGAPNIIFLILDTVRARSLSLYGYQRNTTPNLTSLAEQGVLFERAVAPAPWTLPSHASMFTGRQPYEVNANRFKPLNDQYPTVAEALTARGYVTAGFAANLAYATREFGLARGFHHWDDYPVNVAQILTNSSLGRFLLLERYSGDRNSSLMRSLGVDQWIGHTRSAENLNARVVDWASRQQHRPFFVFANYFDAHWPYLPPAPYAGTLGPMRHRSFSQRLHEERPGAWPRRGAPQLEQSWRDRYEESIAYVDAQVGALLSELRRRRLLENTIIVVASDHGEEFGENGDYEHDSDVSFAQVHVPLLIVAPGRVPQGVRIAEPVGLADLAATLAQLSGKPAAEFPGRSLARFWSGAAPPSYVPVLAMLRKGDRSQASIVTEQYHYIRSKRGREKLYDHVADIHETHDLIGSARATALLPGLRAQLWRQMGGDPFASVKP